MEKRHKFGGKTPVSPPIHFCMTVVTGACDGLFRGRNVPILVLVVPHALLQPLVQLRPLVTVFLTGSCYRHHRRSFLLYICLPSTYIHVNSAYHSLTSSPYRNTTAPVRTQEQPTPNPFLLEHLHSTAHDLYLAYTTISTNSQHAHRTDHARMVT